MEKKYQIFISSTYEDLKEVRQKVIHTILTMNQFPAGMELFSAADEEQWEIIKETIDSSDYYVLIIGRKYGSVISDGEDAGISYTEKEFNYAKDKGIPILAFIMDREAKADGTQIETNPDKMKGFLNFVENVKTGRLVKFWKNVDELCAQLSQTLYKAMQRGNRPGWVRTTEFNIEESYARILQLTDRIHVLEALNSDLKMQTDRKPLLQIKVEPDTDQDANLKVVDNTVYFEVVPVYTEDAVKGIDYTDEFNRKHHATAEEVRVCRHICKNGMALRFLVTNNGDARATGVRVRWEFPKELLVISLNELVHYYDPHFSCINAGAFNNWERRFFAPEEKQGTGEKFVGMKELVSVEDIANLLDPAYSNEVVSIFAGEVLFDKEEVRHYETSSVNGVYLLPLSAGEFDINVSVLCNDMPKPEMQKIKVVVK